MESSFDTLWGTGQPLHFDNWFHGITHTGILGEILMEIRKESFIPSSNTNGTVGGASSGTYKPGIDKIKSIIIANVGILREVHSISSNPLSRLIGESNETEVILEDEIVLALIDSGAVISQITSQLGIFF